MIRIKKKRQKDISAIDDKIISMYAKGMTTRQISDTIEDIYGFEIWHQIAIHVHQMETVIKNNQVVQYKIIH